MRKPLTISIAALLLAACPLKSNVCAEYLVSQKERDDLLAEPTPPEKTE